MGCISNQWAEGQDQHCKWLKSSDSGKKWLVALIVKVWEVSWDMWDNRNDAKHNGETLEKKRRHDELNIRMWTHCDKGTASFCTKDKQCLKKKMSTVLGHELLHKEQWVLSMDLARQISAD